MKYCCKRFKINVEREHLEMDDDKDWNINGCCGGGCYILSDIEFCPFCGFALGKNEVSKDE